MNFRDPISLSCLGLHQKIELFVGISCFDRPSISFFQNGRNSSGWVGKILVWPFVQLVTKKHLGFEVNQYDGREICVLQGVSCKGVANFPKGDLSLYRTRTSMIHIDFGMLLLLLVQLLACSLLVGFKMWS